MVISRRGKIGLIGVNPAALNSVNPSSRGVASRNQDGKPFGAFLQAHNSKKVLRPEASATNKLTIKSRADLIEDQALVEIEATAVID
jgi:hypothetical protein